MPKAELHKAKLQEVELSKVKFQRVELLKTDPKVDQSKKAKVKQIELKANQNQVTMTR